MATTLSLESLPLFAAAAARQSAKAEAEKALTEAANMVSKAAVRLHEACLPGTPRWQLQRAQKDYNTVSAFADAAKKTLRQLS